MTEETAAPQQQSRPQPSVSIKAQHLRHLSFDNPGATGVSADKPAVEINIRVDAGRHSEDAYMSTLHLEATARDGETTIYAVKLSYAGVFQLENVEDRLLEPILVIECPRLLFPFARRIVSDTTRDGGYAPLMLDPVDFTQLYRGELARRAQAQAQAEAEQTPLA